MMRFQFKMKEVSTFAGVSCDVCGKYFDKDAVDDGLEIEEVQSISFVGGYDSVFGDGKLVELDICQHCLKDRLGEFLRIGEM